MDWLPVVVGTHFPDYREGAVVEYVIDVGYIAEHEVLPQVGRRVRVCLIEVL